MKLDIQMIESIGLTILQFTPLAKIAPMITDAINVVEAKFGDGQGQDKLAAVTQVAQDTIAAVNSVAGKNLVDPTLSTAAIQAGISMVVDAVKVVQSAKAAVPATS